METRRRKRAEASSSAPSSQVPTTRASKRSRTSAVPTSTSSNPTSLPPATSTRSRRNQNPPSSSVAAAAAPAPMDSSASDTAGRRRSSSGKNHQPPAERDRDSSDKGKEREAEASRSRDRDRDAERILGMSFDGGGADDDNDSEGGVGILHQNLTSASSALQGLLRKLGAGLDDLLPSSAGSASSSSHQSGRLKKILSGLRADGEEGRQVEALTQLCDMLSIGTEDSLGSFSVDSFVPVLVGLLNHENNPDIMLLAARALTHLCDVLPSSCSAVVHYGAVPCFCARLLTIEYMDLAEQSLQALKKISQEHPTACLRAGALMAVLSYLDFFSTGVQRVALSTAANMCKKLPSDAADFVMEAVPLLTNLLNHHDSKVLEHASVCLTRIAEAFASCPEKLDELCNHGLVEQAAGLISVSNSGGQASLSTSTYTGLIRLLSTCASGSPLGAKTLLLLGISGTLKDVLSSSGLVAGVSVSPALTRPAEQIYEIVNLADELLPPLPQGTISLPICYNVLIKGLAAKKSPASSSPKSSLFGGDGGGEKLGASSAAAPQELTLSYLCENPKPGLQEKEGLGSDLFVTLEKARAKGKEIALDLPDDDGKRWVERDFLQIGGVKASAKREGPEGFEVEGREKKLKMGTLNLSLGPPNLSLSLNSANPAAPPATVSVPVAPISLTPAAAPAKRSFSNNTRATNSDDCGASLSYSCSVPLSHNPSCSLTRNSTENFDMSRENDTMWYAGEGTNGSVHSRFKPVGDSITFSNLGGFPHMQGENKDRANCSESISFFPAELSASPAKANAGATSDAGKESMMLTRLDRVLKEMVSKSVPYMAQILQDFPTESLEAVKECLRNLMSTPEKRDQFANLQRRLKRRSDLTCETLSKCHRTQLEVLVAIKTGIVNYVSGRCLIPSNDLVEIFTFLRCPNVNCKSLVPVDDCECKICSGNKGFCSSCMCPVCLKFDCAANTCSWVGCDVCSHWCHAACGIEKNLIKPGSTLKGPMGMTEMQFHCPGCEHASEMFGFVKEVFNCCAKDWGLETLLKELDCVRNIFRASEDFEGKGLHAKTEEILNMLAKKLISPIDACNNMLQFFKYGVTEFSVTGSSSKNILGTQANQHADTLPLPPSTTATPPKSVLNFKPTSSIVDTKIDSLKTDPKHLAAEAHFTPGKEDSFQSLETTVKYKEAEAKLFQRLADEARRELEGYRQIARAKSEKLEEEYATKLAKLCLQETEDRRRRKLEELKFLENSHCDYHKMKMRMQAEIAGLLERMEATKKMWV